MNVHGFNLVDYDISSGEVKEITQEVSLHVYGSHIDIHFSVAEPFGNSLFNVITIGLSKTGAPQGHLSLFGAEAADGVRLPKERFLFEIDPSTLPHTQKEFENLMGDGSTELEQTSAPVRKKNMTAAFKKWWDEWAKDWSDKLPPQRRRFALEDSFAGWNARGRHDAAESQDSDRRKT